MEHYTITESESMLWIRVSKLGSKLLPIFAKYGSIIKAVEHLTSMEVQSGKTIMMSETQAEEEYQKTISAKAFIIPIVSNYYNPDLKSIDDAPIVLYAKGNIEILQHKIFAIVGSRSASAEKIRLTYNFAKSLSEFGFRIVSGFANGIDSAACKGALPFGTVQVLGCGVDVIYPHQNAQLYNEVLDNGGLFLAEVPCGMPARPANFPPRNRIISGLAKGLLLAEASRRNGVSGSLITVKMALAQGNREVFAFPGSPLDPKSTVCNNLIKNGTAIFTTDTSDITDQIGYHIHESSHLKILRSSMANQNIEIRNGKIKKIDEILTNPANEITDITVSGQSGSAEKILNCLSTLPINIDDICEASCYSTMDVQIALSELELLGSIQRHKDGKFSKLLL